MVQYPNVASLTRYKLLCPQWCRPIVFSI